jgi:hypothetical protein
MQMTECSSVVRWTLDRKGGRHSLLATHCHPVSLQGEQSVSTLNMRRALSAALTGLALAAITQISYAARDVASETQVAGLTETSQIAPAPAIAEPSRAGRGSPVTLYLEDASGNAFRLVYVAGTGWRSADGWKSPDSAAASPLRKVASSSTDPARPPAGATPDGEPLTVFIDGPSGFTFVWDRDGGWKFVGKIADDSP